MTELTTAQDILLAAAELIDTRAEQRDHANGERSVPRAVAMFNDLTAGRMTDRDGWIFMALLKLSRAQGGRFHQDDYIDAAAYIALACESETQLEHQVRSTFSMFSEETRRAINAVGGAK